MRARRDWYVVLSPLIVSGLLSLASAPCSPAAATETTDGFDSTHSLVGSYLAGRFARTQHDMPSAAEFPSFDALNTETPSPRNALGAKGIGESGTIGSTPAVQSAVVDALSHLGIRHLDIPCTPERVWAAVRAAEEGHPPEPWRDPPPVFAATGPEEREDAEAIDI